MLKKLLLIVGPIILIFCIVLGVFYWNLKNPASIQDSQKIITIGQGDNVSDIAGKLYESGVIKSKITFVFYSYISGKYNLFQPGRFYLNSAATTSEITSILTKKPKDEIKITIPEGWRATQIGEKLESLNITTEKEFVVSAKNEEGYLFPDTYYFLKNTPAQDVVTKMKENFSLKTSGMIVDKKILTIASIVEREAKFTEDRPIIAGIFYNRLNNNIKLEADPTIQYAIGDWNQISGSDLHLDSLYNTYKYAGLPPTPICNPGLDSIRAAVTPVETNYVYFINSADGKAYFAVTKEEQASNIKKYLR